VTAVLDRVLAGSAFYVPGLFLSNLLIAWGTIEILRRYGRKQRKAEETLAPHVPSNVEGQAAQHEEQAP
jgi:hypothetical protein